MRIPANKCAHTLGATLLFVASMAHGAQADREQPIYLESDSLEVNDQRKVSTYIGNVRLTQGSMEIRANRLVVKQDDEGFSSGAAQGSPASFRQKLEGSDEYIEGYAERIEYDGKREKLELFVDAKVKRGQSEVRGSYISYDGKTGQFQVKAAKETAGTPATKSRVHAVIQPKPKTAPADTQP